MRSARSYYRPAVHQVTLHTFATSPYGLKVQAYLANKRIPYETVYADPFRLKRVLPVGKTVPVLTIDGESRSDSHAQTTVDLAVGQTCAGDTRPVTAFGAGLGARTDLLLID
jgi:hypothetical protein